MKHGLRLAQRFPLIMRLRKGAKHLSRNQIYEYWKAPDEMNDPKDYLTFDERSKYLVSLFEEIPKTAKILELGCNVGRNLNHLWQSDYHNLSGIEINRSAIELMKSTYKDMKAQIYEGTIEDNIKNLSKFDVIFTMAVLEHIHNESDWVFAEMVKKADVIITIEDEKNFSERHFPRNYQKIFESLGMMQVYEKQLDESIGLNNYFYSRVFKKP